MDEKRKLELLAYASVCFEKSTDPFALRHLQKKKVDADECRDLSHLIAEIIDDELYAISDRSKTMIYVNVEEAKQQAKKDFLETQESP